MTARWVAPWRPAPFADIGRPVVDLPLPGDTLPRPRRGMAPLCVLCGRLLTDPTSRARGLGPRCARRAHGRTAVRASVPAPRATTADEIPGQTELTWST